MTTPVRALFERLLAGADAAHAAELRFALDVYGAAGDDEPESVAEFVTFVLDGEHFDICEEEGDAFEDAEIKRRAAFTAWFRELCVRAGLPLE